MISCGRKSWTVKFSSGWLSSFTEINSSPIRILTFILNRAISFNSEYLRSTVTNTSKLIALPLSWPTPFGETLSTSLTGLLRYPSTFNLKSFVKVFFVCLTMWVPISSRFILQDRVALGRLLHCFPYDPFSCWSSGSSMLGIGGATPYGSPTLRKGRNGGEYRTEQVNEDKEDIIHQWWNHH